MKRSGMGGSGWMARMVPVAAIAILLLLAAPAAAELVNGFEAIKGSPSATKSNGTCQWTSTLDPVPAISMTYCDWVDNALDSAGFGDWTVSWGNDLAGSIAVEEYNAYVYTGTRGGGAIFDLKYNPGEGDPAAANAHWIQAIYTNCPTAGGKAQAFDAGEGYYQYLDNVGNPAGNPYYDGLLGYSPPPDFWDAPARFCPSPCPGGVCCDWEAQVFLVTGDLEAKTLDIYEGFWWGFELSCEPIPEPFCVVLVGSVTIGVVVFRRRRILPS